MAVFIQTYPMENEIQYSSAIYVKKVIAIHYDADPERLNLEILSEAQDASRTPVAMTLEFSEQAIFAILSAAEDILNRKSGGTRNTQA